MKKLFICFSTLLVFVFSSCCKKNDFRACFTVDNSVMLLGDTVKINVCINNKGGNNWDMGDGTTYTISHPKHVYKARGTFIIKLKQTAHHEGIYICKPAEAETQQTVTVQ